MQTQQLPRSLRFLTLALAIPAVSMIAMAQTSVGTPSSVTAPASASNDGVQSGKVQQHRTPVVPAGRLRDIPVASVSAAPADYRIIDSLENAFSYYTLEQHPFVYDPTSGLLATIKRGAPGDLNNIYVRTSSDMGQTWSTPRGPLHSAAGVGPGRYPSMLLVHPPSDPSGNYFFYTFPLLSLDAEPAFGRFYSGLADATGNELLNHIDNGVNGNTWGTSSKSVISNDSRTVISVGDLSGNNIGVRRFSLDEGSVTSTIPDALSSVNFSDPGSPTSRTAVIVNVDKDAAGAFYLGIYSRFPDQEVSRRMQPWPAVSKSSDNGVTWNTLNIMPISVLVDYITNNAPGVSPDSALFVYNRSQDFVVTGPDRFSFVMELEEFDAVKSDAGQAELHQIVEAYYDGAWHMRKISDATNFIFGYDPIDPDTTRSNQLAREVMISRTADGNTLMVKWVDALNYTSEQDLDGDGVSPDTLLTSDVFVSLRRLESNTWSDRHNLTETPLLDRITWFPDILPNDLSNIPMLSIQAITDENDATAKAQLVDAQLDVERNQHVVLSNYDVGTILSVGSTVASRSGLSIDRSYPNPASSRFSVSYSVPASGEVSIKVYDVLGNVVLAPVAGERAETGSYTKSFDLATLPTGAYRIVLTQDGASVSQSVTIVR
jgi:hypothetical protein